MRFFLILLMVLCVTGNIVFAQIERDSVKNDSAQGSLSSSGGTLTGDLFFSPDGVYDIGDSGANRPEDIYVVDDVDIGGRYRGTDPEDDTYLLIEANAHRAIANNVQVSTVQRSVGLTVWDGDITSRDDVVIYDELKFPDPSASLPSCDSSSSGDIKRIQLPDSADFYALCLETHGKYVLRPMPAYGIGANYYFTDFIGPEDAQELDSGTTGVNPHYGPSEDNHPGIFHLDTGTVANGWSSVSMMPDSLGSTSNSCIVRPDSDFTYEGLIYPSAKSGGVLVANGMFSDLDDVNDAHMAFFEYDSDPNTVTDASNASPIVITTSSAHNYDTGDVVNISNILGNTAANGNFTITDLSANTFSLDGSVGNGAYVSGGDVEAANWKTITRDTNGEGSQTKTDTGIPFATNTWFGFMIQKTGGSGSHSYEFSIYVNNGDYVTVATHTSTLPQSNDELCPAVYIETPDTGEDSLKVDLLSITMLGIQR